MANEFELKKLMCEIGKRIYQREMVAAFMEGVHPYFFKHLFSGLRNLLMKKYPFLFGQRV